MNSDSGSVYQKGWTRGTMLGYGIDDSAGVLGRSILIESGLLFGYELVAYSIFIGNGLRLIWELKAAQALLQLEFDPCRLSKLGQGRKLNCVN